MRWRLEMFSFLAKPRNLTDACAEVDWLSMFPEVQCPFPNSSQ